MRKTSGLTASILQYVFYLNLLKAYTEGSLKGQYVGCYYDTSSQVNWIARVRNSSQMTIKSCIQACTTSNFTFVILQEGSDCMCGDILNTSVPNYTCQIPCSGNQTEVCGGSNGAMPFSVIYTVCPVGYYGAGCDQVCHCKNHFPCYRFTGNCLNGCDDKWTGDTCNKETNVSDRYIGCYRDADQDHRALSTFLINSFDTNTIESCSSICASKHVTYAGLQQYSYCLCGESYDSYGTSTRCSTKCTGNAEQTCGGAYANSVYYVCPKGSYGKDCVARCNCNNTDICPYSTGLCIAGCKPGWSGSSCSDRDCSTTNGACSYNETCVTTNLTLGLVTDLAFASVNRCQCSLGFQRTILWDNCTDIDECNLSLCDRQTTTCNNTMGSFVCNCRIGYQSGNSSTFCEDIDECSTNRDICGSTLKYCVNTVGSYKCMCVAGYEYEIDSYDRCNDIDECTTGVNTCDNNTQLCKNTVGRYFCTCRNGFQLKNESLVIKCEKLPPTTSDAGKVAGAVIGTILGLALIAAIVLLVLYLYRKRRREKLIKDENRIRHTSRTLSLYANVEISSEVIGPNPGNALNTLRNKLSDPNSLKEEFQSVALQPKDFCALGTREELKKKNRFINIIPYESNRVILSRTSDDDTSKYINASYIKGYNNATKFIAAQGPREETLEDFWRMIIENRVHLIVMITNLVENLKNKCEKYWPELGHPVVYGDITVTLKSEDTWPDYTVRCIQCQKNTETVQLQQFHYLSWPDHGVPSDIKGFLAFRRIVRQHMRPDKYTVVHCSAGAGRTGAFIAIDYLLEQEKVEHNVRILDCLKELRGQRSHMIQNLVQYVFVHNALLLAFEIGDTRIPTTQYLAKYTQFQLKDPTAGKSILETQFELLEQVTMEPEETAKYRVLSNVIAENKIDDMKAVFVQSWKLKDAYIAAQPTDSFTSLWELRAEHKCAIIIYLDPSSGLETLFFPTKDNPKSLSNSTLICEGVTKEEYGSRYIVSELREQEESTYSNVDSPDIYQNTGATSEKTQVTILHVTEFLGKGSWDAIRLKSMFDIVRNHTSTSDNVPVMVVSSDCSLSGFCLAAFNAFEMMKQEETIDLYQIVLNIRKSRTDLFNSMSSYIDLHNVVERYIVVSTA